MAASPEPIAKVREMIWLTLIPISCAAPLSSEQARMALPVLVRLMNRVRQIMTTMQVAMVRRVR